MNLKYILADAKKFKELDNRLSLEVCLAEATLKQVILDLNRKGKIPQKYLIDNH